MRELLPSAHAILPTGHQMELNAFCLCKIHLKDQFYTMLMLIVLAIPLDKVKALSSLCRIITDHLTFIVKLMSVLTVSTQKSFQVCEFPWLCLHFPLMSVTLTCFALFTERLFSCHMQSKRALQRTQQVVATDQQICNSKRIVCLFQVI